MQQSQQKDPFQDARSGFNMLSWALSGYATAILPFIRRDFGVNFFGLNALVAIGVMLVFGAVENTDDLMAYMALWLLLVAAHRLDAHRNYRRGQVTHSRHTGDSLIAAKLPASVKRKTVQMLIEPGVCLIAGALLCPHAPGCGRFLIGGAFAVMAFNGTQRASMQQRVRSMRDAHIEQQVTAQMFRGRDDDF